MTTVLFGHAGCLSWCSLCRWVAAAAVAVALALAARGAAQAVGAGPPRGVGAGQTARPGPRGRQRVDTQDRRGHGEHDTGKPVAKPFIYITLIHHVKGGGATCDGMHIASSANLGEPGCCSEASVSADVDHVGVGFGVGVGV